MMLDAASLAPIIRVAILDALASPEVVPVWDRALAEMKQGAELAVTDPFTKDLLRNFYSSPTVGEVLKGLPREMTQRLLAHEGFIELVAERVSVAMRAGLT